MARTANIATKTDLKKLGTKLGKAIGENREATEDNRKEILGFKWEIDKKLLTYQQRTEKMMTDFKDVILKAIDGVMKELLMSREEMTIMGNQLSGHDDKLENHESRIIHLEGPPPLVV